MKELSAAIPAHLMHEPTQMRQKNVLGKDDFLRLLMTQLKYQDPLNPQDHEEFATQLAQFSSLEQLSNIGKGIDKLQVGMSAEEKIQALNMIGKEIKASGNKVELLHGQEVALKYLPDPDARPFVASIYDKSGKVIRELNLSALKPTDSVIQWDGRDQTGHSLPAGDYTFRVFGVGNNGQSKELNTELSGKVVGVEMTGKEPVLVVNTGSGNTRVELAKVNKISVGGESVSPNGANNAVKSSHPAQSGDKRLASRDKTAVSGSEQNQNQTEDSSMNSRNDWFGFVDANAFGRYQR